MKIDWPPASDQNATQLGVAPFSETEPEYFSRRKIAGATISFFSEQRSPLREIRIFTYVSIEKYIFQISLFIEHMICIIFKFSTLIIYYHFTL